MNKPFTPLNINSNRPKKSKGIKKTLNRGLLAHKKKLLKKKVDQLKENKVTKNDLPLLSEPFFVTNSPYSRRKSS